MGYSSISLLIDMFPTVLYTVCSLSKCHQSGPPHCHRTERYLAPYGSIWHLYQRTAPHATNLRWVKVHWKANFVPKITQLCILSKMLSIRNFVTMFISKRYIPFRFGWMKQPKPLSSAHTIGGSWSDSVNGVFSVKASCLVLACITSLAGRRAAGRGLGWKGVQRR